MSSTILLAIRSTIQNRRNFFQENWVWNHLARILMCRATTSLSLGCTLAASLCCTTGIFRELSWGGAPWLHLVGCLSHWWSPLHTHAPGSLLGTWSRVTAGSPGAHITQR